jgi:hypothetical protein
MAPGTGASSRSSRNMRIDGMSIPYADRVSLPWLLAAALHLDNPAMPDSFRKRSDGVNNAAT